jgi:hypothetical protein
MNYAGVIAIGFGDYPVIPFDNGQGLNEVLVTEFWFGVEGRIEENAYRGYVRMNFPIASNPAFVGLDLLAQFGVFDGAGFRLSEVIGIKLLGP